MPSCSGKYGPKLENSYRTKLLLNSRGRQMTTRKMFVVILLALVAVMATPSIALVYAQGNQTGTVSSSTPQLPIDDLTLTICLLVAVAGTITAATLGWLDSGEPFNGRKFTSSILHAVVAGIVIVIGYSFRSTVDWFDFVLIFLTGAGVDVTLNRIQGAIVSSGKTSSTSTTTSTSATPSSISSQTPPQTSPPPAPSPPAASPS